MDARSAHPPARDEHPFEGSRARRAWRAIAALARVNAEKTLGLARASTPWRIDGRPPGRWPVASRRFRYASDEGRLAARGCWAMIHASYSSARPTSAARVSSMRIDRQLSISRVTPVSAAGSTALDLGTGYPGGPHRAALIRSINHGDRRDVVANGELVDIAILKVSHAIIIIGRIQALRLGRGTKPWAQVTVSSA